jgi:hypothetical protein
VNPAGQHELLRESLFEWRMAFDLAANIADDAAELGLQGPERSLRPLELLGMRVALLFDESELADRRLRGCP